MSRIRILPPEVASKIAAGEVITRPASVVKELVENALDAGARTITVDLTEGGRRRIRVVDDGGGMTPEDARLSLERHATSKLRQDTDLLHLATLGFRGEALPSIAAVSHLELITRTADADAGHRLRVAGGKVLENTPWAAPVGTQVTVEDLFYNTPARRKFLKSPAAEQGQILELLRSLAVGYPELHLTLWAQGKALLRLPAHQGLSERVAAVLGTERAERMLPFALDAPPYKVSGLILAPDQGLASNRFQFLLVNRRLVADRLLSAAVREAYQGLLPRGRYPAAVVLLDLPPEQVDVNVHPAKAEIRFRDSGRIYALVLTALRQGLALLQSPGRSLGAEFPRPLATWQPPSLTRVQENFGSEFSRITIQSPEPDPKLGVLRVESGAPVETPGHADSSATPLPTGAAWRFGDLAILSQLQASYILAEAPEGLVLIDQHAAHERILYEALAPDWQQSTPRQTLLFPKPVELEARQAAWLQEHLPLLAQAGIEVEPFGGNTFLITAIPACLGDQDLEALLLETVDALAPLKDTNDIVQARERLRLTMACRGAIKAGQRLTREEMHHLLVQLDSLRVSSHCPHGRPLWRLITIEEIRQSFRRPRH